MFRVPKWEEDIPKSNLSFKKSSNKKQKLRTTSPNAKSLNTNTKSPIIKEKKKINQNTNRDDTISRKRKVNGELKTKKKESDTLANIDTDKLDEVILNAKKKKFNEALLRDDVEDVLFKENNTSKNKKPQQNNKKLQQKNNKPNRNSLSSKSENKKPSKPNTDNDLVENGEIFMSKNNNKVKKKAKFEQIPKTPAEKKKERLKQILSVNRNSIAVNGNKLRERMLERLKAAQFRYLNEKLYTSSGSEAKELFTSDPTAFRTYHDGYQQQVKKWPVKPLDVIVKRIRKMPKTHTIADMGCGEAALSRQVPHTVRSFDLVATSPGVEVCDMSHTPLLAASVDVAVYCLALMGTELTQFLVEANRVLKTGGHLLIAEVESRFDKVDDFTKDVEKLGFKLKKLDKNNDMFFFMEFVKVRESPVKKAKLPTLTLKPCLYKRR